MRGEASPSRNVWAIVTADRGRVDRAGLALAGEAQRLAAALGGVGVVLAFGVDGAGTQALASFAERVLAAPDTGTDGRLALAASLIAKDGAGLILVGELEHDVPGRLAARLGAGIATGCSSVEACGEGFVLSRPVCGGLVSATLAAEVTPVVATILSSAIKAPTESEECGSVEQHEEGGTEERVRVVARDRLSLLDLPLTEAEAIVAGGLGLGGRENVPLLEDLADALGGTIAGSRPAVDRGWLPPERQVGQSGAIVAPKVYIACGISGALQHVVGIRGAGVLIAVNKDPGAPIMKLADVPIVGDVREVLPELTAAIRSPAGATGSRPGHATEALR